MKTNYWKFATITLSIGIFFALGYYFFSNYGNSSAENKPTQNEGKNTDLNLAKLEEVLKPSRDNALFQLETTIKKREVELAQFPRDLDFEPDKCQAQVDKLQIEADHLRGKLEIERNYYNSLLTNTNNRSVAVTI